MELTLKAARVNSNLTQKEAADKLGVSPVVVSNWERNLTFPNVLMMKKIGKLYNVKFEDIIFMPE